LLTIVGGKWTTYRHMAEDVVDQAITLGRLDEAACVTRSLRIHGYEPRQAETAGLANPDDPLDVYGSDASLIRAIAETDAELANPLDRDLTCIGAQIVWAARNEMARTVDDALSRRTRALLLNASAATRMAPAAARLLARELGRDQAWIEGQVAAFRELAAQYNGAREVDTA
jgi:glycerol-3-phosphate dehydrogenase